jgi:hypothetical protein
MKRPTVMPKEICIMPPAKLKTIALKLLRLSVELYRMLASAVKFIFYSSVKDMENMCARSPEYGGGWVLTF